ncbi:unnamed protein product [Boreogadus saida]
MALANTTIVGPRALAREADRFVLAMPQRSPDLLAPAAAPPPDRRRRAKDDAGPSGQQVSRFSFVLSCFACVPACASSTSGVKRAITWTVGELRPLHSERGRRGKHPLLAAVGVVRLRVRNEGEGIVERDGKVVGTFSDDGGSVGSALSVFHRQRLTMLTQAERQERQEAQAALAHFMAVMRQYVTLVTWTPRRIVLESMVMNEIRGGVAVGTIGRFPGRPAGQRGQVDRPV